MSTPTPPADPQTPAAGAAPGQTPPTGGQTALQTSPTDDTDMPLSVQEARRLRAELKQRRESEAAAQIELNKLKTAQLTDSERKEQRLTELEKQALTWQRERQELLIKHAVTLQAVQAGVIPELAEKLLDWSEIETDKESGEPDPESVKKALKELLKKYPQLAIQPGQQQTTSPTPAPSVAPTNPGRSQTTQTPQWTYKNRPYLGDLYSKTKPGS